MKMTVFAGVAATLLTASAAFADAGTVQIGQCGTASGSFVKLKGLDRANGFAGGDLSAVLVNAGNGSVGVTMVPSYKRSVGDYIFTKGTLSFKGDANVAKIRACFGVSFSTHEKKLSALPITTLPNGWSQVSFTQKDFDHQGFPILTLSVIMPNTGNITVGNTNLSYVAFGDEPGTSMPSTANLTVGTCSVFRDCQSN